MAGGIANSSLLLEIHTGSQVTRKLFGDYGIRIWGLFPKELLYKRTNMQRVLAKTPSP